MVASSQLLSLNPMVSMTSVSLFQCPIESPFQLGLRLRGCSTIQVDSDHACDLDFPGDPCDLIPTVKYGEVAVISNKTYNAKNHQAGKSYLDHPPSRS